jgi:hypothetical protein
MLYFFTVWNIIFLVFHKFTSPHFDLLYLSYITMMIGLYLSYVNPRFFAMKFRGKKYVVEKWYSKLPIDIIHILIFLVALYLYGDKAGSDMKLLNTILLFILYISMFNGAKIYSIKNEEFMILFSVVTLIYFTLF